MIKILNFIKVVGGRTRERERERERVILQKSFYIKSKAGQNMTCYFFVKIKEVLK